MGQYWKILWPIIIIEHQPYNYHQTMHDAFLCLTVSKVQKVINSTHTQLDIHQICCVVNLMKVGAQNSFKNI